MVDSLRGQLCRQDNPSFILSRTFPLQKRKDRKDSSIPPFFIRKGKIEKKEAPMKVILLPGNGSCSVERHHWYKWLRDSLFSHDFEVIAEDMPDPHLARRSFWIPFIEEKIGDDPRAILIGHSSGALAAMRYIENHPAAGVILVSACHTDLGLKSEKISGYYREPWGWDRMKENTGWIVQLASTDDPFIPIEEARFIHEKLQSEYFEFNDRGHFMGSDKEGRRLPEALDILLAKAPRPSLI
jgi:predicted alpha/beta hydrolase family esterase